MALKNPLPQGPALPVRLHVWDASASAWVAMAGNNAGQTTTTIDGGEIRVRTFNISATGTNTITAVSSGLKLYKAFAGFEETVVGNVVLEAGATEWGRLRNPIVGGNHILATPSPNYETITATGTLKVVLPTATSMVAASITLHYELT